jgi:hypothetical protein
MKAGMKGWINDKVTAQENRRLKLKEKSGTEIKELRNGRKYTFRFLKTGNFS